MKNEYMVGIGIGIILFLMIRGLNLVPWLMLGALAYLLLVGSGGHLRDIGRKRVGAVVNGCSNVTFSDIGGQSVAKRELIEALEFLKNSKEASRLGIRPLKGILLVGPPGTGKTLLAKGAATHTNSAFLSASGSEFIEVYAGLGAQRVRELFDRARKIAKEQKRQSAIIFIDEIEVLAGKRGTQTGHLEYDQTLNQLLVEMDGLNPHDSTRILVIGATNRSDLLDPAIVRPGRFDRLVKVDLPDKEGRLEILKLHLKGKPIASDVDIESIAEETFGLSGAHLESLCNEAAILALRKGSKTINNQELEEALDKVIMGEKLERRPSREEMLRVSVHEAGHAIAAEKIRPGSVAQVTVSPRGNALGYVRHSPKDDPYIYSREELEEEIMILLAGALAEDLVFGSRSTGASNDFQRALSLAKRIVSYGMSSLGIVDRDTASSDAIARATREIIDGCEVKVKNSLAQNRSTITRVSQLLAEKETVSGEHLRSLLKDTSGVSWKWRKPVPLQGKIKRGIEAVFRG
jgi:cell division protease FtsH